MPKEVAKCKVLQTVVSMRYFLLNEYMHMYYHVSDFIIKRKVYGQNPREFHLTVSESSLS